jgi:hypothetical protein
VSAAARPSWNEPQNRDPWPPPGSSPGIAAKFAALPESIRNLRIWEYPIKPSDSQRERLKSCMLKLRHNGWNIAEAIELARAFPNGMGSLGEHTGRILAELWRERMQEEAEQDAAYERDGLFDPWQQDEAPPWPERILSRQTEATLAHVALRDGIDYGAACFAHIVAASGAAPKNIRFRPYDNAPWDVPPIVWLLLVADTAQRKTALMEAAFGPLRQVELDNWRTADAAAAAWKATPEAERGPEPPEPHTFLMNDATAEATQIVLAKNERGSCVVMDEIARLLDFSRYTSNSRSGGASERSFYLEAYEGNLYTVHRVKRGNLRIPVCALTVAGGIQPDRLADFSGLESDGLIQRFGVYLPGRVAVGNSTVCVRGENEIAQAIKRLANFNPVRHQYTTTKAGSDAIKATERDGSEYAQITEYGIGFQGFCGKLHGLHARLAFILHLLNGSEDPVIPTCTILAGGRLTRHLLRHAKVFFAGLPKSGRSKLQDIAGWLLTKKRDHVRASDLTAGVKACRGLSAKDLNLLLEPLVLGDWLTPDNNYGPANRGWTFNSAIPDAFAERTISERQRRAAITARINRIEQPEDV